MALTTARSVNQANTESVRVRDVSEDMVLLEPDQAPLLVLTTKAKRKSPSKDHKIEWVEDAEVSFWGQANAGSDYASNVTNIAVTDGTLFAVGDLVAVCKANSSSAAEEAVRVTAVSSNTLTITRNVGSAGADTIGSSVSLRILGPAFAENAGTATIRSTTKVVKTSYVQIFKDAMQVTDSAEASETYGAPEGERKFQQFKLMQRHRAGIESAILWGRASEALSGAASIWTTMGLKSRISTNLTDVSTTFTVTKMNDISETAFRYGQPEKLAIAAPKYISGFAAFSQAKLNTVVEAKVFGVNINKIVTPFGTLMLANNFRMEAGVSGQPGFNDELYIVDLPSVRLRYLRGLDTKLHLDVEQNGATAKTDEIRSYIGAEIRHEQKHSRAYNCSAYTAP